MKIISLNIVSFGKLKNVSLNFGDANFIYAPNEGGKSTLAAFVAYMLFGDERAAKKYIPWDGEFIEGSLNFLFDSMEYRVYRRSGGTAKTRILNIVCLSSGKQLKEMPFKGDGSLYAKTAFICQSDSVFSNGDELSAALRQQIFGGDENKVRNALSTLEQHRKLISNPRGKLAGALEIQQQRLNELLEKKAQSREAQNRLEELSARLKQAQESYDEAYREFSAANASQSGKEQLYKIELLKDKIQDLQEELRRRQKILCRGTNTVFGLATVAAAVAAAANFWAKSFFLSGVFSVVFVLLLTGTVFGVFSRKAARLFAEKSSSGQKISRESLKLQELEAKFPSQSEADALQKSAKLKLDAAAQRLYSLQGEIALAQKSSPKALDEEIYTVGENCAALEKKLENILLAQDAIKKVSEKLNTELMPKIAQSISETACKILGREVTVVTDRGFNLTVTENSSHSSHLYSDGTDDQLYLAVRLAVAEIIFGDEAFPLLLDDPFIRYDSQRREKAIDILLNLPQKNQIILFSCKNSSVFKNKGFNVLTI